MTDWLQHWQGPPTVAPAEVPGRTGCPRTQRDVCWSHVLWLHMRVLPWLIDFSMNYQKCTQQSSFIVTIFYIQSTSNVVTPSLLFLFVFEKLVLLLFFGQIVVGWRFSEALTLTPGKVCFYWTTYFYFIFAPDFYCSRLLLKWMSSVPFASNQPGWSDGHMDDLSLGLFSDTCGIFFQCSVCTMHPKIPI